MRVTEYGDDGKPIREGYECAEVVQAWGTLRTNHELRKNCATMDKLKNNVDQFHDNMAQTNMRVINELAPLLRAMTTDQPPALPPGNGSAPRMIGRQSDVTE